MATEFTKEQIAGKEILRNRLVATFWRKYIEIFEQNFGFFKARLLFYEQYLHRDFFTGKYHIFSFQRRFRALRSLRW